VFTVKKEDIGLRSIFFVHRCPTPVLFHLSLLTCISTNIFFSFLHHIPLCSTFGRIVFGYKHTIPRETLQKDRGRGRKKRSGIEFPTVAITQRSTVQKNNNRPNKRDWA
jgi:hypothetical protein